MEKGVIEIEVGDFTVFLKRSDVVKWRKEGRLKERVQEWLERKVEAILVR